MTSGRAEIRGVAARLAVLAAIAALPGCGGFDGVELNGKVFEAVGLTGSLGKKAEPRTEARAPLVLPPPGERLPEPGALAASAPPPPAAEAWPNDPDKGRHSKAEALKQAQAAHCKDGNWKEKAHGDDLAASQGPAGSCNSGSIFSVIGKSLFGE